MSTNTGIMIKSIDPQQINPLHEVRNLTLLNDLVIEMTENGWEGRPLLVVERAFDYLAWTGSHRIAAAREVGLPVVPCYVIQERGLIQRGFDPIWGHVMDYERLEILRRIGDDEATHLMWQEGRS